MFFFTFKVGVLNNFLKSFFLVFGRGKSFYLPHPCLVVGQWTSWGKWSRCSRTCGGGEQSRKRSCRGPWGRNCPGRESENRPCNSQQCPGGSILYAISMWSYKSYKVLLGSYEVLGPKPRKQEAKRIIINSIMIIIVVMLISHTHICGRE